MAIGMDQLTGKKIEGLAELKQRIQRLMHTRKGTLLLRRDYGSNLPQLVDSKITPNFPLELYAETSTALADPANELVDEFKLSQVKMNYEDGDVSLTLQGEYLVDGSQVTMEGITL